MKLVTFEVPSPTGPLRRIGAQSGDLADDRIVDLNLAYAAYLAASGRTDRAREIADAVIPPDMIEFFKGGELGRDAAGRRSTSPPAMRGRTCPWPTTRETSPSSPPCRGPGRSGTPSASRPMPRISRSARASRLPISGMNGPSTTRAIATRSSGPKRTSSGPATRRNWTTNWSSGSTSAKRARTFRPARPGTISPAIPSSTTSAPGTRCSAKSP